MSAVKDFDLIVLGAGPAGLAAANSAVTIRGDLSVLVIEREERAGGILKQCIHDGFGLVRYKEKLTGPEYARRDLAEFEARGIQLMAETYVSGAGREGDWLTLVCVNRDGIHQLRCRSLVLATGCRERTDRQVFIHGDRPAGIFTAGLAQALVNLHGLLPGRRALILGSGDIGLIMARRLTLEGMEVAGVYEVKPEVSGLERNVQQCVLDFAIPLHLSTTVTRVFGKNRVEAVELCRVDAAMQPLPETAVRVACDTLILSVGLIPENEIAASLGVSLDPKTKGPYVDQNMHTLADGVFACGNAVHVNDLVDYVSESAVVAGAAAARYALAAGSAAKARSLLPLKTSGPLLYAVPQYIDTGSDTAAVLYFRSSRTIEQPARLELRQLADGQGSAIAGKPAKTASGGFVPSAAEGAPGRAASAALLVTKKYSVLRPPEMERVVLPAAAVTACRAFASGSGRTDGPAPLLSLTLTVEDSNE